MARRKAYEFVLYVGDGAGGFDKAGVFQTTELALSNEITDVTDKNSVGKREILPGAGLQSWTINASGMFNDSAVEETIRSRAQAQSSDPYQIRSGSDIWEGDFVVSAYSRSGGQTGAEEASFTLESDGAVTYTPA